MRTVIIALLFSAVLLAGCSQNPVTAVPGTSSNSSGNAIGQGTRTPMRMHALAVGVCPSPSPSPLGLPHSECTAQVRVDLPLLPQIPGLTITQIPGLHPSDLRAAYNLPSSSAGRGQTIAIIVPFDSPTTLVDLTIYRTMFGLPPCLPLLCFNKYSQSGSPLFFPPANLSWQAETDVDTQVASAVCPLCKIVVVEANDDTQANLQIAMQTAVNKFHATVLSNSWVIPETASDASEQNLVSFPNVAVVAASGDGGYAGGAVWPASAQGVISVGGTTLTQDSSARGWSESVWSYSGSACSAYIAKPAWQTDGGCAMRTLNDISAVGDPATGVAVYDTLLPNGLGGWLVFGGTSVATPLVAATIALAGNAAVLQHGAGYIANAAGSLNQVSGGTNGTCADAYLCTGLPGFNAPAGYGSPNGVAAL